MVAVSPVRGNDGDLMDGPSWWLWMMGGRRWMYDLVLRFEFCDQRAGVHFVAQGK